MTSEHARTFHERGIVVLRGALRRSQLEPVKAHVLDELSRLKIWSGGKALSQRFNKVHPFQQITQLSALLSQDTLHAQLTSPATLSAIASLGGNRLAPAQSQFLISLPNQGDWTLEALRWHVDISASPHGPLPGIQAFFLVDDVKPRGGATLAIAGSHRPQTSQEPGTGVRDILRRGGDIESALRRSNLEIVEMSGNAGDVYLMDMRVLHSPSVNSNRRIRFMATVRYLPGQIGSRTA